MVSLQSFYLLPFVQLITKTIFQYKRRLLFQSMIRKVKLGSDVLGACWAHALTTETEEVGFLIKLKMSFALY